MSEGLGVTIRRDVAAIASAALLGVALQGCGGDDSDTTPDSGLPSESELTDSTPTSTPTDPTTPVVTGPQEPALPEAAKAPGKRGARAFVAYYIKLLNYASLTGDTKALRASGPACAGCQSYVDLYERTYRNGGWFKGGEWTPVDGSWLILPKNPGLLIDIKVDAAPGRQLLRRNAQVTRFLADRYQLDFHLAITPNGWTVTRLETPA